MLESMRGAAREGRSWLYMFRAMFRGVPRRGRSHDLPGELIVSLTSYPRRFITLDLALACLFDQTVRPDRVILWVSSDDFHQLPGDVVRYRMLGLDIRICDDIGPYKKLIPALETFPEAFVVTADDDLYYPSDWLESLVDGVDGESIICRWGTSVRDGEIDWPTIVRGEREPSFDVLPGSGMGMLFPPHSLHPHVTDREFLTLCPTADDLWYYWMAKRAGTRIRKVRATHRMTTWPGSQANSLWSHNRIAGHDRAVAELRARFA